MHCQTDVSSIYSSWLLFFCGDSISDSVVVVVVVVVVAATTTHARMIVCDGHLVSD